MEMVGRGRESSLVVQKFWKRRRGRGGRGRGRRRGREGETDDKGAVEYVSSFVLCLGREGERER